MELGKISDADIEKTQNKNMTCRPSSCVILFLKKYLSLEL